jgi:hypothetical protein
MRDRKKSDIMQSNLDIYKESYQNPASPMQLASPVPSTIKSAETEDEDYDVLQVSSPNSRSSSN